MGDQTRSSHAGSHHGRGSQGAQRACRNVTPVAVESVRGGRRIRLVSTMAADAAAPDHPLEFGEGKIMRDARVLELLEQSIETTETLLGQVAGDRWPSASPCEGMNAHELVEHLVGGLLQFAAIGEGQSADEVSFEKTFPVGTELHNYDSAGDRMLSAWSEPGVIDRTYEMPWGDTPGSMLIGFMLIEQVVHGWDLAKAAGEDIIFDDEAVETTLDIARESDDEAIRVPGMFASAVEIDDEAPAIDRLAAFLGRHPEQWP